MIRAAIGRTVRTLGRSPGFTATVVLAFAGAVAGLLVAAGAEPTVALRGEWQGASDRGAARGVMEKDA